MVAPEKSLKDRVNVLVDKDIDNVDSVARYMAYDSSLRTALRASTWYIAYVRGIGCEEPTLVA